MSGVEPSHIRQAVEKETGEMPADIRFLSGGHDTVLYLVDMKDGTRLVAKYSTKPRGSKLDVEGWMLSYLTEHSDLPVPDVIACSPHLLLMSYISTSGVLNKDARCDAADYLAALHGIRAERFGLERDTLIGPLTQPNTQEEDWLVFFRDHRLLYMAERALEEGAIDRVLMKEIETVAGQLHDYIPSPDAPSLIHGDMWSGNILCTPGKVQGFIDPAIYYADPEIELAFSTLFNTFDEAFFDRYNEIRPIKPGFFETRKDLYNLYPLLVHVRLFGGTYIDIVKRIVSRFVTT